MIIYFGLRSSVNKAFTISCKWWKNFLNETTLNLHIWFSYLGHKGRQCKVFSSSNHHLELDTSTCHYLLFHLYNHFLVTSKWRESEMLHFAKIPVIIDRNFIFQFFSSVNVHSKIQWCNSFTYNADT